MPVVCEVLCSPFSWGVVLSEQPGQASCPGCPLHARGHAHTPAACGFHTTCELLPFPGQGPTFYPIPEGPRTDRNVQNCSEGPLGSHGASLPHPPPPAPERGQGEFRGAGLFQCSPRWALLSLLPWGLGQVLLLPPWSPGSTPASVCHPPQPR